MLQGQAIVSNWCNCCYCCCRFFLGSVSNYCSHHAKCPVLVVKKKLEWTPDMNCNTTSHCLKYPWMCVNMLLLVALNKDSLPIWKPLCIQSCTWTNNAEANWVVGYLKIHGKIEHVAAPYTLFFDTKLSACSSLMPCMNTFPGALYLLCSWTCASPSW